ncbi:SDR family NAD(P)-dependent oxidoreductase [Nocardia sp. NPDC101769]|uniref:SDR family NAD(P)-dependent oxidoreductase n=1 Tax=Nocardia sp. NPDC101769 TaxID=3364333 RepID=UPI0038086BDC
MGFGSRDVDKGVVLVLGGRSEIGLEVARRLSPGRVVILAARRSDQLQEQTKELLIAEAAAVHCVEFDADDMASHQPLLEKIIAEHGRIGVAVVAFGILGDQARAEEDPAHAVEIVLTDFVAQVSVLTSLANLLREQGDGQIVVFSSIAGVRVRRGNYVYGSAKTGLDGFATGMQMALHGSGVHLLMVRSGFVIGRMTAGMEPAPLSSTPDQVADAVVAGLYRRGREVAVPRRIRLLFVAMRYVPYSVWRRMPR